MCTCMGPIGSRSQHQISKVQKHQEIEHNNFWIEAISVLGWGERGAMLTNVKEMVSKETEEQASQSNQRA